MDILKLFRWGGNAGDGDENHCSGWEELPYLAKINIIRFLDKESMDQLAVASQSARDLLENIYGMTVVIPARNWTFLRGSLSMMAPVGGYRNNHQHNVSDKFIEKVVRQAEGKKIRDLEMTEMPGACSCFTFDRFITHPGNLKFLKLKYCDIRLIYDFLTKCNNLKTFHYQTGIRRKLPSGPLMKIITGGNFVNGPVPTHGQEFLLKLDTFPNTPFQLNNLNEISLTMEYMLEHFFTDWHNVIYVLLRLPALPSVTKFKFKFSPRSIPMLLWKTHFLILACLADFLPKLPNLTYLQYHSTFNVDFSMLNQQGLDDWRNVALSGLIERFGSNQLRQMNVVANGPAPILPFLISLRQTMNLAAGYLHRLETLDWILGQTNEHQAFQGFNFHLPARVTKVAVTDSSNADDEPNAQRINLYKMFLFPHNNAQRLPMLDSILSLSVHCTKALIQQTSLTRVLEGLPQLKELEVEGPHEAAQCNITLEDRAANPEIFTRLENLRVHNVCLICEVAQAPPRSPVLCRLINLKELSLESSIVEHGILVIDVMKILGRLRQLNKVRVKPMLFYPFAGQLHPNGKGLDLLEKIGHVKQSGPDVFGEHVVRVYDFSSNVVQVQVVRI